MRKWLYFLSVLCLAQIASWANSVTLLNDTSYTLQASIYDATGASLGQFTLNPRDATLWSDSEGDFGVESQYASQTPYTVYWYCMSGGEYGTCDNVAAGAVVTAQSCGGDQECPQQQLQPPY